MDIIVQLWFISLFVIKRSSGIDSNNTRFSSMLSCFEFKLYFLLWLIYSSMVEIILAGFPPTTTLLGTDFVTTEPAATNDPSPIVMPGIIRLLLPMYTQFPITTLPNKSKSGYAFLTAFPPPCVKIRTPFVIWQWLPTVIRYGSDDQQFLSGMKLAVPILTPISLAYFSGLRNFFVILPITPPSFIYFNILFTYN